MIAHLVGQCHVAWTYTDVLRHVIKKLKGRTYTARRKVWRGLGRDRRREILSIIVNEHRDNRNAYSNLMRGRPWS